MSQNTDFEWYKYHLKELYDSYGDKIVVVKDQNVEGIHSSFAEAFSDACKHFPVGSFIIQKLGPDEEAYTTYIYSLSGCIKID